MATICLHGDLARFGAQHQFAVTTPAEAVRALCAQLRGFRQRLQGGMFRLVRVRAERKHDLSAQMLDTVLDDDTTLHLLPVIAGSGGRGIGKAILGIVLVAAAFAFAPAIVGALGPTLGMATPAFSVLGFSVSFSQIAGFGAAMILGGVIQALSPTPAGIGAGQNPPDANASSLFNGPANVAEQGNVIPVIYGRFIGGSLVIAAALISEQISAGSEAGAPATPAPPAATPATPARGSRGKGK